MVTVDEVARMATELPEVTVGETHGNRAWSVGKKAFAWVRPFSKADLRRFGAEDPPPEPIVALRVEDLHEKEAVLAAAPAGFFTIPHFDGYAAVLVELGAADRQAVHDAIVDAWLACAPAKVADAYLADQDR
jgi:hypothetical protein